MANQPAKTIRVCLDLVINDDCLAALGLVRSWVIDLVDLAEFMNWVVPHLELALQVRPAVWLVAEVPRVFAKDSRVSPELAANLAQW